MLCAGIDVGTQSVKAVVFDGERVLGQKVRITEEEAETASRKVYEELLAELGLKTEDVERVFATGCWAGEVSFAEKRSSEQVCAARGARWLFPNARTVVDVGAEGCRVMKLGPDGTLEDFANNSKCASGTGSSIELGAVYLKVPLEQMGPLSLAAEGFAEVSSTCTVFAESVIISNIHKGEPRERIAAGVHRAVATRIAELIGRVGLVEEAVLVGGGALNQGLVAQLESMTGVCFRIPENPRTVGALGAAIQASVKRRRQDRRVADQPQG
jgi:predicted CoA-substrate-specific enzyme activase